MRQSNYSVQVYEINLDQSPGLEVSNQPVGTWSNPGDVNIAVCDWMTFSLNTAVRLEANKQYGIRITHINGGAWSNGTPKLQASTNNFSGGTFFADTDVANTAPRQHHSRPRAFHLSPAWPWWKAL